ncbi:hypothetical protein, partial [Vibrio parahaemolyticus]|uniref:hypothetical protein n=1 Tax=Vibrio parahaemolyticus TaxID=670 RepID=UPI00146C8546
GSANVNLAAGSIGIYNQQLNQTFLFLLFLIGKMRNHEFGNQPDIRPFRKHYVPDVRPPVPIERPYVFCFFRRV